MKLLLLYGIISTWFTIKTTLLGVFNWSMMSNFTQGSLSIKEYFFGFQTLWIDYFNIVYANVPAVALSTVQAVHATNK